MIAAALDVGTNTLRVLIKDTASDKNILKKNYYLFLGQETVDGMLSQNGIKKLENVLPEIRQIFYEHGVSKVFSVATAFARKLGNMEALKDVFLSHLNADLSIIDAETEGEMVFSAISRRFGEYDFWVIDMGGGSTEFIFSSMGEQKIISLDLGSLFLARMFFSNYPPGYSEKESLCELVISQTAALKSYPRSRKIFGTGGTVTTLAFLLSGMKEYKPEIIDGFEIAKSEIENLYHSIEYLNYDKLVSIYPVEKGREKVLLAGSLMLLVIMNELGISRITASDVSLLDGIIPSSRKNASSI